jgi:hypothetical protein
LRLKNEVVPFPLFTADPLNWPLRSVYVWVRPVVEDRPLVLPVGTVDRRLAGACLDDLDDHDDGQGYGDRHQGLRGCVLHRLNPIASRLRPSGFAC